MKKIIVTMLMVMVLIAGTSCAKKEAVSDNTEAIVEENTVENSITEAETDDTTTNTAEESTIGNDNSEETDITYHSKAKDDVDPNYLDEIGVVAGSKYISSEDQNVYFIFNEDGTVILSERSYALGEYDVRESNYIVENGEVLIYYSPGLPYIGFIIKDNTISAPNGEVFVKE